MIDEAREVTYEQLATEVLHVAAALVERDIEPGDVVALRLPNSIDYTVAFHGALTCGAIVTPVATYATAADVQAQLTLTRSKLIIDAATITELRNFPHRWSGVYPSAESVACLPMSSGTTGLPKAVQLTHANLVSNTVQFSKVVPVGADDVCLAVLPFTHIYGLTALMNTPLLLGATVIAQSFTVDSCLN